MPWGGLSWGQMNAEDPGRDRAQQGARSRKSSEEESLKLSISIDKLDPDYSAPRAVFSEADELFFLSSPRTNNRSIPFYRGSALPYILGEQGYKWYNAIHHKVYFALRKASA